MAAEYLAHDALRQALAGKMDWSRQQAEAALAITGGKQVEGFSGLAFALAGDGARAEKLSQDLEKRFPKDTVVQFDYLPMIRAALALRAEDPAQAIEALSKSAPYQTGQTNSAFTFSLYPAYLRGCAYLAAKRGAEAKAEFQEIVGHRGIAGNQPIAALALLGLARAEELTADHEHARQAYGQFLQSWKDADADLPVLQQARSESAALP